MSNKETSLLHGSVSWSEYRYNDFRDRWGTTGSVVITLLTTDSQYLFKQGGGVGVMGDVTATCPTEWVINHRGARTGRRGRGGSDWNERGRGGRLINQDDWQAEWSEDQRPWRTPHHQSRTQAHVRTHTDAQTHRARSQTREHGCTRTCQDMCMLSQHHPPMGEEGCVGMGEIHPGTGWVITAWVQMDLLRWLGHRHTHTLSNFHHLHVSIMAPAWGERAKTYSWR